MNEQWNNPNGMGMNNPNGGLYNTPNQTNLGTPMGNPSGEMPKKKGNKGLIITLCVIFVILLIAGGCFFYATKVFNATKYLDETSDKVETYVREMFEDTEFNSDLLENLDKYDITNDTNVKFTTSSADLSTLNNIEVNLKTNVSFKNSYEDMDITLKQDNASLNASLAVNQNNIYLESKDLIDKVISTSTDENMFSGLDDYKQILDEITKYDISSISTDLVSYLFEALKEANISTKYGLLKATYTYEINDSNKDAINDKFIELAGKNENLADFVSSDVLPLGNVKVSITVNMLTKKIDSFTITEEDSVLTGKRIADNKYNITSNDKSSELEIADGKIVITGLDDDKYTFKLESKDKNTIITYEDDEVKSNITLTKEDKNNLSIQLKVEESDIALSGNISILFSESNKTEDFSGKLSFTYDGINADLVFTNKLKYGENIVNKKTYSNAVDVDSLTDEDKQTMLINFYTKALSFKAYNFVQKIMSNTNEA